MSSATSIWVPWSISGRGSPRGRISSASQRRIAKIKLFVYGYCRGRHAPPAPSPRLKSLLDDAKCAHSRQYAGGNSGWRSDLGYPHQYRVYGAADTVSAVGVPHILPSATGHRLGDNSPAAADHQRLLKSYYHFVAGHEQRRPAAGLYPGRMVNTGRAVEVVYPGCMPMSAVTVNPPNSVEQTDAASLLSKGCAARYVCRRL